LKQVLLTPSAEKRLMAKALTKHHAVQGALRNGTLVIVADTPNGYIA
jgi:hypothetical protein